jgi:putative DNA primase/helicase
MLILKESATLAVEVTCNGRLRAPVIIWRRGTDETLLVDAANLVSAREREQLIGRLPEGLRAEAARLLEQIGLEVAKADTEQMLRDAAGDQASDPAFADPDPWPVAVDLAPVLERIVAFIRRFVVLPEAVPDALAAWAAFTYASKAFLIAPYVIVRSPIMRCGKSLLLEVMELLIYRPFSTVSASAATLFRVIDESAPTIILDEAEVLASRGERAEAVREILNAGHRRGPGVPRCVGEDNHVELFRVFGPKILAAIGRLWDTLEDRSLLVDLKRKRKDEPVERFRRRQIEPQALELRRQLHRWAQDHMDELATITPPLPAFLDDRAQDTWEGLFAIAQVAGGGWPERLVAAAVALNSARVEDDAPGVQLLADFERLFTTRNVDRITSAGLVEDLKALEDRSWAEWKTGKPITARQVANLLKKFGIKPKTIRVGTTTPKGYALEDCQDAFSRYLTASDPQHPQQSSGDATISPFDDPQHGWPVADHTPPQIPHGDSHVADVADPKPGAPGGDNQREAADDGIEPHACSRCGQPMQRYGPDPRAGWVCARCYPDADRAMRVTRQDGT